MGEKTNYDAFFKVPGDDKFKLVGKSVPIECAKLEIHKHPRERKYLEVRIEYSEQMGNASKSLNVDTFLTFKELRKLYRDLIEGAK